MVPWSDSDRSDRARRDIRRHSIAVQTNVEHALAGPPERVDRQERRGREGIGEHSDAAARRQWSKTGGRGRGCPRDEYFSRGTDVAVVVAIFRATRWRRDETHFQTAARSAAEVASCSAADRAAVWKSVSS